MDQTQNTQQPQKEQPHKKPCLPLWITLLIGAILLAIIGYLIWLIMNLTSQNATLKENTGAQKASTPSTSQAPTDSPLAATSTCSDTATASLKENISAAVSSHNYAALEGYMADSVNVVIAASEYGGSVTKTQAVSDMAYLTSGTDPWNFAIPAATLTTWRAHFYTTYFSSTSYAGESANHKVVSFDFNCSGKIDQVFMVADSSLLAD